ncbi:MAG TPA: hypothetical protein VFY73_24300 [Ideonella sp.]|uniref:hypothetical protein n=1 Tax=Ideonella sp. TaxID=1929293 RepID=UPI002E32624A|nr:hypothetical protein [Ideonella sp.]HEX5687149.1 hypothetical protein [Ideonella sp.]
MTSRAETPAALPGRRRPGMAAAVLALHLLLFFALAHTMRERQVDVRPDRPPLVWVQPLLTQAPPQPAERAPSPAVRQPRHRDEPAPMRPSAPAPAPTRESIWVEPAPMASAAPPAPVASAPPAERLMDTEATRAAIRQTGQLALLHERASAATGIPIARTDTALAREVAEAGTADCLKDPKAASGQIGPIGLGGILGLPFLAARVATGRCAK